MGRPREFDCDDALCSALSVFWSKGYEGASLTDLTEAMGITRPSLYATFGNKEDLFRKALDRYEQQHIACIMETLRADTARDAIERMLSGYAEVLTDPVHPPGCLGVNASTACGDAGAPIRKEILARRALNEDLVRARLEKAKADGELDAADDPADWASYVMSVGLGMAVKAGAGAPREELERVVKVAMRAWPTA